MIEEIKLYPEITGQEVMAKFAISKASYYRYKKKALAQLETETRESLLHENNMPINANMQGVDPIWLWDIQHEDDEEGWQFHVERGKAIEQAYGTAFASIWYPTSEDELHSGVKKLCARGVSFEWIMHDKDYWLHDSPEVKDPETGTVLYEQGTRYQRGELKTRHVHLLLKFDHTVTNQLVNRLLRDVLGHKVALSVRVNSVSGMHRYLTHSTEKAQHDGKFQYEEEELHPENGFSVDLNKSEKNAILISIADFCLHKLYSQYHRYEFSDLIDAYQGQEDALPLIIGHTVFFKGLLDSKRHAMEKEIELVKEQQDKETRSDENE